SAGAESGARTALPAWLDYMQIALSGIPEQPVPPPVGLASVRIDLQSGLLSRRTDYTSTFEYFKPGTEPTQYAGTDVQQISFDNAQEKKPEEKQQEVELF
ncbi:MAG TPA: penicillin-sensitive transpeptidase, partial [Rheinheimera sp.]